MMKRRKFQILAVSFLFIVFPSKADESKVLFDGKTLTGWSAPELSYWSVEDGAITATASEANPCTKNQFLVWQGGDISDFRLTLKFKVDGGPKANSGVQVRSQVLEDGHAVGYQVDISQPEAPWLGAIYDEHGRKMLSTRGEKTVVKADGSFEKTALTESGEAAISSYKVGEWNAYEIVGKGNQITVRLNGYLTAEVIDLQEEERELSGILALQLHSGPPMRVQFKDLVLTNLSGE